MKNRFNPKNSIFHPDHDISKLIHQKPLKAFLILLILSAATVIMIIVLVLSALIVFRKLI